MNPVAGVLLPMRRFHPMDRGTDLLLPLSVQDWLSKGHLARYVVESESAGRLGSERAGAGVWRHWEHALSPGYAVGVADLWLRHRAFLQRCSRFGSVCLVGTKIHANASPHSALSYGHAEVLEAYLRAEVQELLALAERTDGAQVPDGMSIPAELERRVLPASLPPAEAWRHRPQGPDTGSTGG